MNKTKYTCDADSLASLLVLERDMDRLSFITEREGSWTGSAWLSREATADLARRLAEHVGLTIEPEPFKRDAAFEDIRKGDLVRVEYARNDLSVTRTGTAFERVMGGWYTPNRELLCGLMVTNAITILSRPETEPEPDPLPTTPGAVVLVHTWGEWVPMVWAVDYWYGTSSMGSAYEWTSEQVASVEWKPAKVVEA